MKQVWMLFESSWEMDALPGGCYFYFICGDEN